MEKRVLVKGVALALLMTVISSKRTNAQIPVVEIIKAGVKKVIMAVDLQVQRMQNKTIWLQNAQKELENILSETKLDEISGWVQKQKDLYGDYFNELWQVKDIIEYYHRIKEITEIQIKIVNAYESAFNLFKQDEHFTSDEIQYMGKVYSGIIDASIKNLDQLSIVINSFSTQMSDENRLGIINQAAEAIAENYSDLKAFNSQNMMLSLQRSKDLNEASVVKQLYGLQ
jgi:hypothetical protein